MTAERAILREAVGQIIEAGERDQLEVTVALHRDGDPELWNRLAEAGMTAVGVAEEAGGSGGTLLEACDVVAVLAQSAAQVPLAEHLLVALPVVIDAGLARPDPGRPVTCALGGDLEVVNDADGAYLRGSVRRVPWGRFADLVLLEASRGDERVLCLVEASAAEVTDDRNLAGEPRETFTFVHAPLDPQRVRPLSDDLRRAFAGRLALARAVQLSAGVTQILDWTVQYVSERSQFGRSLSQFQSVQADLALMASECFAATALSEAAVVQADRAGIHVELAAASYVRAVAASRIATRTAHQLHGAIGFTLEHRLHTITTALWSLIDEGGDETRWAAFLGESMADSAPHGLWAALTSIA
jgi:acyl-CoA dehydrogenase